MSAAEHDAEQNADIKPGPPNPRAEGADAPSPPGGPQRQDDAGGDRPGGHDDDASASPAADRSAEEAGGHTIPVDEEQPDPGSEPGDDTEPQEENAETSLDQPSQ